MSDQKKIRISISGGSDVQNAVVACHLGYLLSRSGVQVESRDLERVMQMTPEEQDKFLEPMPDDGEMGVEIVTVSNPPVV